MSSEKILVTGFGPFQGIENNPTSHIAKTLDGNKFHGIVVKSAILEVDLEKSAEQLRDLLSSGEYIARVHFGVNPSETQKVEVERVAINVCDFLIPDTGGRVLRDRPIIEEGATAFFSTLPVRDIIEALAGKGIKVDISNSAGTYICNYIMYLSLYLSSSSGKHCPSGFVHVPTGQPDEWLEEIGMTVIDTVTAQIRGDK